MRPIASGPLAASVAATIRALEVEDLPGVTDFEAAIPPTGRAWVRRVRGENVWLWYRASDDELVLVTVTRVPPVPIE